MAFNDNGSERQMVQGDWQCSSCGNAITELPFRPDPDRVQNLKCRDCFKPRQQRMGGGGGGGFRQQGPRQMFQGNWKCSSCGTAITELPFQPSPDREGALKCRNCFRR